MLSKPTPADGAPSRRARLLLVALALVLAPVSLRATDRMTLPDLVALLGAGMGDDVILAQVRATGTVFDLSTREILLLHDAGASDALLAALISTRNHPGREERQEAPVPPPGISYLPSEPAPRDGSAEAPRSRPAPERTPVPPPAPAPVGYAPVSLAVSYPYPLVYPVPATVPVFGTGGLRTVRAPLPGACGRRTVRAAGVVVGGRISVRVGDVRIGVGVGSARRFSSFSHEGRRASYPCSGRRR